MPVARKGMARSRHGYVGHRSSVSNHPVDFGARLLTGYSHFIPDLLTGLEDAEWTIFLEDLLNRGRPKSIGLKANRI
jgi:hypothetical protein